MLCNLLGESCSDGIRLFRRLAPTKHGKVLLVMISTTIIGYFLGFLTPLNNWQVLFVSFMIAFSGFVGDIVMSALKRDIGVKDTGTIIPGHGGILDRIDSLAYTAPTFFHLVYYIAY